MAVDYRHGKTNKSLCRGVMANLFSLSRTGESAPRRDSSSVYLHSVGDYFDSCSAQDSCSLLMADVHSDNTKMTFVLVTVWTLDIVFLWWLQLRGKYCSQDWAQACNLCRCSLMPIESDLPCFFDNNATSKLHLVLFIRVLATKSKAINKTCPNLETKLQSSQLKVQVCKI